LKNKLFKFNSFIKILTAKRLTLLSFSQNGVRYYAHNVVLFIKDVPVLLGYHSPICLIPIYFNIQVNHENNFSDLISGAHTQNIERLWRSTIEQNKEYSGTHRSMFPT